MTELPRHGSQFARRDFLKLSSLAVAGLAGGALPVFALPLGQRVSRSLMSIGFAAEEPEANRPVQLDAAAHLLTSDPTFLSRDALVTIRSSARALSQSTSRGAAIDVVYPALGFQPDRYPAYRAWSCRIDDHGVESGGGVAFRVPVDGTNGLQLVSAISKRTMRRRPLRASSGRRRTKRSRCLSRRCRPNRSCNAVSM